MARLSCGEVATLVVEALKALKPAGDSATVEKLHLQRVLDPDFATTSGKKVYVAPLGKSQAETATRGEDLFQCDIRVFVVERYTTAGDPTETWLDARTKWVEDNILHAIGDARIEHLPQLFRVKGLWPETAEVAEYFDDDLLRRSKLFFSAVDFSFRRFE